MKDFAPEIKFQIHNWTRDKKSKYIVLRWKHEGKYKYPSTGIKIKPNHFNNDTGRAVPGSPGAVKLNKYLAIELNKAQLIIDNMSSNYNFNIFWKKYKYDNQKTMADAFLEYLEYFFKEREALGNPLAQETKRRYKISVSHFKKFNPNVKTKDVSAGVMYNFAIYLSSFIKPNRKNTSNSVIQYINDLKRFYDAIVEIESIPDRKPFKNILGKMKKKKAEQAEVLSVPEVKKICFFLKESRKKSNSNFYETESMRFLLFCCATSLRRSDASRVSYKDVGETAQGKLYIKIESQKTKKNIIAPILPFFTPFMDKSKIGIIDENILNIGYNRINKYYIIMSEKLGINKKITTHTGRRTFATICKNSGLDSSHTQDILGHASISLTHHYTEFNVNNTIDTVFEKWENLDKRHRKIMFSPIVHEKYQLLLFNLNKISEKKNINYSKISEKINISKASMSLKMQGSTEFNVREFIIIMDLLEISFDELLREVQGSEN